MSSGQINTLIPSITLALLLSDSNFFKSSTMKFEKELKEFGRQAMGFLNISRPSSWQGIISTNHCQWIRSLIAFCRFKSTERHLEWIGLDGRWYNNSGHQRSRLVLAPTYMIAYRTTGCPDSSGHPLHSAGSNPRNDASSRLVGTNIRKLGRIR